MLKSKPIKILQILCIIITTIIVTGLSMAKYSTTVTSSNKTTVATPIMQIGSNTLNVEISPTDEYKTYNFKISNNNGEKTSEVSMQYTLQVKNLNNLPLDFELYTIEKETVGTKNILNGNITEQILMNLEAQEHNYQLKIKWRKDEKDYKYAKVIDYVQIIMRAEQID